MSGHETCHFNSLGRHYRFVLLQPNGGHIPLPRTLDDRICCNTDVSWAWEVACSAIDYPAGYLRLAAGEHVYRYAYRLSLRDRTLLQDLRLECVQQHVLESDADLPITVIFLPPPERFGKGLCLCDFPGEGCCLRGTDACRAKVAHVPPCFACGYNAGCRAGQCEHTCCPSHQEGTQTV